jgi:hypothetical protein
VSGLNPQFDAFRMHDEQGFPLTYALSVGADMNTPVNIAAFACDAYTAGWSEDKVRRVLAEACVDNGIPFHWDIFKHSMAALWTAAGRPTYPEAFTIMKEFIMDAPLRCQVSGATC